MNWRYKQYGTDDSYPGNSYVTGAVSIDQLCLSYYLDRLEIIGMVAINDNLTTLNICSLSYIIPMVYTNSRRRYASVQ